MKLRNNIFLFGFFFVVFSLFSMGIQKVRSTLETGVVKILTENCSTSGCHTGAYPPQGLNLDETQFPASVIDVPSQEIPNLKLVDPQNPDQSYLLMKIKGSEGIKGRQMPAYAQPLKPEEISAFEKWVQNLEDSNDQGEKKTTENKIQSPAFWGTRLVNLPTARTIGKGNFLFRVSHRFFPAVKEGYDVFYGLNGPASVLLGFGYGFTDKLDLTLFRANESQEFEFAVKYICFNQDGEREDPFSLALLGGFSLITLSVPGKNTFRDENFRVNLQSALSYKVNRSISLLLVPGYSTNTNPSQESGQGTLSLGLGGRAMIINDLSVLLEWIPVLAGYSFDSWGWGLGIEKKIGGHVFQVFALNSVGMTTPQFVPGGNFRIDEGEFRFGFTIFRWF